MAFFNDSFSPVPAGSLPWADVDRAAAPPGLGKRLALFLDYDGTLTPIVPRPEDALLSEKGRAILRRLKQVCPVGIISGRGLEDVRGRVGLKNVAYAGSHGLRIDSANPDQPIFDAGAPFVAAVREAARKLREGLDGISGAQVEEKDAAVAVHFRRVAPERHLAVDQVVTTVAARFPRLRLSQGKMVRELQPNLDWNKGQALLWLVRTLGLSPEQHQVIYIGDDVTDEDAFTVLRQKGLGTGIVVGEGAGATAASYRLRDPEHVLSFLEQLVHRLERQE